MFYVLSLVAVGCCGLFAGAAVYINLVEHPVRLRCGMDEALREWASSYGRASVMQASLALLGGVAGVLTRFLFGGLGSLLGALLLLAVVPFTLLAVYPTNKALFGLHERGEVGNAHELLARWNALHGVRTVLSVVAFAVMLLGVAR